MRFTLPRAGFAAVLAAASPSDAAVVYYAVQTGMQGGQTQIDQAHTSTWSFTTGQSWVFGGGSFEMKDGPSTVADITLSLYDGGSNLVAARTLANAPFSQSFNLISFLFQTPVSLNAGASYSVALTSNALDQANRQYFIKGANSTLKFVDGGAPANPIPDGFVTFVSNLNGGSGAALPEPMTLSLLGAGLLGVVVTRARRRRVAQG